MPLNNEAPLPPPFLVTRGVPVTFICTCFYFCSITVRLEPHPISRWVWFQHSAEDIQRWSGDRSRVSVGLGNWVTSLPSETVVNILRRRALCSSFSLIISARVCDSWIFQFVLNHKLPFFPVKLVSIFLWISVCLGSKKRNSNLNYWYLFKSNDREC